MCWVLLIDWTSLYEYSKVIHLRIGQQHWTQSVSQSVILFLKHIGSAKVGREEKKQNDLDSQETCKSPQRGWDPLSDKSTPNKRVNLQVSPESLSPAMATNLLTPSSSGLDTLVLVFAIMYL